MKENYTKAEKTVRYSIEGDSNAIGNGNVIGDNNYLLLLLPNKFNYQDVLSSYNKRNMCNKDLDKTTGEDSLQSEKQPAVVQNGEHSNVNFIQITHTGEGDIVSSDTEVMRLTAQVKSLQEQLKDKDKVIEGKDRVIETQSDEIKVMKEELSLLRRNSYS